MPDMEEAFEEFSSMLWDKLKHKNPHAALDGEAESWRGLCNAFWRVETDYNHRPKEHLLDLAVNLFLNMYSRGMVK